jgi:hypothetical protein
MMAALIRVVAVAPVIGWAMRVTFTDATEREIDLYPYIADGAIFAPVRADAGYFRRARVDGGTIVWPNGADIDPDVLYHGGTPPWAMAEAAPSERTKTGSTT